MALLTSSFLTRRTHDSVAADSPSNTRCRFWDTEYFGGRAAHFDKNYKMPNMRQEGLSFTELQHHRTRIASMIGHLRKRFPEAPIMYKPSHLRASNAHTEGVPNEPTVGYNTSSTLSI